MSFISKFVCLLFVSLMITQHSFADNTIYLTRHAEKMSTGKNPELDAIGQFRTKNIAAMLSSVGITHIFSTDYNRTKQTATPLAKYLNLEIQIYNPADLNDFAEKLKKIDGAILVVGHSNTTPQLTTLLSGKEIMPMQEKDYDTLYQVISTGEEKTVNHLRTIPSYILSPTVEIKIKANENQ